jgi:hypothetical protein
MSAIVCAPDGGGDDGIVDVELDPQTITEVHPAPSSPFHLPLILQGLTSGGDWVPSPRGQDRYSFGCMGWLGWLSMVHPKLCTLWVSLSVRVCACVSVSVRVHVFMCVCMCVCVCVCDVCVSPQSLSMDDEPDLHGAVSVPQV